MTWKAFANQLACTSRRRGLTTAVIYGLTLTVRFTSATGEEADIPAQAMLRSDPVISITTRDQPSLHYHDWIRGTAQATVLHQGWKFSSPARASAAPGCIAP